MTNRNSAKRIIEDDSFIGKDKKKENSPIIGVVGLGYVGLPVAVGFSDNYDVVGFDVNKSKIEELTRHIDRTSEVSSDQIRKTSIDYTCEEKKLKKCNYIIVAVPTPIKIGRASC